MDFVDARDTDFIDEVAQFHERREEALEFPLPSDLLLALYGYARGIIALQMFRELETIATAVDLSAVITKSQKRVKILNKRAKRMLKNEPTWKPSTRKQNTYKAKAMVREAMSLADVAEKAADELKQLEGYHV